MSAGKVPQKIASLFRDPAFVSHLTRATSAMTFCCEQSWLVARTLPVFLVAIAPVAAYPEPLADKGAFSAMESVTDCRYLTTENPELAFDNRAPGGTWFPQGDLFRPPVADLRQPRFYLSPQRIRFEEDALPVGGADGTTSVGIVGIGTEFGIWKRTRNQRCNGVQVSFMGAITSQFNLDAESDALLNTDFMVGPSVTLRRGRVSARIRAYHQSSHLGDEFILDNPDVVRVNLSFEVLDGLVSYEASWWRVYGGAGLIIGAQPDLDPTILSFGTEFRSIKRRGAAGLKPVLALDVNSMEARDWDLTASFMAGIEMSNPEGTHRYRLLLSYIHGFIPFGQFFNTQRLHGLGVILQFDF